MSELLDLKTFSEEKSEVKKKKIWNTCDYQWTINNFSELKDRKISPCFQVTTDQSCPVKWSLWFYPLGETASSEGFVSLFLHLDSASKFPAFVKCELSVQNSDLKIIKCTNLEQTFTKHDRSWGYDKFLKRDLLTEDVVDNVVQIRAHVRYSVDELENFQDIDPDPELLDAWCSILENSKFTDVMLVVEGEEIKAHKVILASRSPVFMAMFSSNLQESVSGKVKIPDFTADIIRTLLRYIYLNELEIKDTDEAMSLARAAEKYEISELKRLCADYLKRKITVLNTQDMLLFSDMHNLPELKQYAMEFIFDNPKKFLGSDQLTELAQHSVLTFELFSKTLEKLAIK